MEGRVKLLYQIIVAVLWYEFITPVLWYEFITINKQNKVSRSLVL